MIRHHEPLSGNWILRLRAAAKAARQLGMPTAAVEALVVAREQLRPLLPRATPGGRYIPPPELDLHSREELLAALSALTEEAAAAGVPAEAITILGTAHRQLAELVRPKTEQRGIARTRERRRGHLKRTDGQQGPVLVLDRSPRGLGLVGGSSLAPHELVEVVIPEGTEAEDYLGEVVFCYAEGGGTYHIGVELLFPPASSRASR